MLTKSPSMSCFVVMHDLIVSAALYGLLLVEISTVCVLNVSDSR